MQCCNNWGLASQPGHHPLDLSAIFAEQPAHGCYRYQLYFEPPTRMLEVALLLLPGSVDNEISEMTACTGLIIGSG